MSSSVAFGRCSVCAACDLEVDDGGYLYCGVCGARESPSGELVPSRMVEKDYRSLARGIEACSRCKGRNTRRESDLLLVCFDCLALEVRPVPENWLPEGARCSIGIFRGPPRPGPLQADPLPPFASLLVMLSSDSAERA